MPAQLVQLEAAPDLVDRVYRSLLDAISDGSLAPGPAHHAGRHRAAAGRVAPAGAAGAAPAEEGRLRAGRARPRPAGGAARPEWMRKVYQVRGALDALAARLAAQRRFRMDPPCSSKAASAARGDDVKAMIDADLAFHAPSTPPPAIR
jgi:hypothetical protein